MLRPLSTALLLASALSAHAQETAGTARLLAATCASCHGTEGRSSTPEPGSLAGRRAADIVAAMQAFRDGKRPATVMQQLARGYSAGEVERMAAFFAAQKP
ncbi:MAG: c-type cytochrome [Betaproteobacteria bacterium]|nr:c-type cytochrome [Betaproteobacteria bacterium]